MKAFKAFKLKDTFYSPVKVYRCGTGEIALQQDETDIVVLTNKQAKKLVKKLTKLLEVKKEKKDGSKDV